MRTYNHKKIKKRRIELKLTQAELAKKIDTAREHIAELESGRSMPKAPMLAKLATALSVSESYFFD